MQGKKAVITGIGCVTPVGNGADGLWEGIRRGKSAVRRIDRFAPVGLQSRIAAQVAGFDPALYMDAPSARRMDRCSQLAVAAGAMALRNAGLGGGAPFAEPERTGVFMGSALGGIAYAQEPYGQDQGSGTWAASGATGFPKFGGGLSGNMAMQFGFTGPSGMNGLSCASGAAAIGRALQAIRRGEADVVLAGGAEAPLSPLSFAAFDRLGMMSVRNDEPECASRPFDRSRDGFVMGEGAAVLVIEEEGFARARGARMIAELAGFAVSRDSRRMNDPFPCGPQASHALRKALLEAEMMPGEIGYINAHGASTPLHDAAESTLIRSVFGSRPVKVSGTKGLYGHPLGASGAIEAAIACLALRSGWLPPTANLLEPDIEADLDFVAGEGTSAAIDAALSNSFGFGGVHVTLAFRRR